MRNIILLGALGSIGLQTVEILQTRLPDYNCLGLAIGSNTAKGIEVIKALKPKAVCCRYEKQATVLTKEFPDTLIYWGDWGLLALLERSEDNILVVNALVGSVGLKPTVKAIQKGFDVALANKETLVMAGELIMPLAKKHNVNIIPIDSEHSAIMQVMQGENPQEIKQIIITASGGALRDKSREELVTVTKRDALNHPNWNMGAKITIDSATMMNKGFEVIEAIHLFNVKPNQVKTVLHRQSIVHSIVEFNDYSQKAQLGKSDMRIPIMYALTYPKRFTGLGEPLSLIGLNLTFEELSLKRYPCLAMAYYAIEKGNIYPTVLNAANEAAVKLFLEDKIKFLDIERIVKEYLDKTIPMELTIDNIIKVNETIQNEILNKDGGLS